MSFDRNDPADLAALKAEATNDPQAIGYTVLTDGADYKFLDEINTKNFTVSKPKISSASIRLGVTYDAYDGLLTPEQGWLQWVTGSGGGFDTEDVVVTDDMKQNLAGVPTANNAIWAAADRVAMNAAMLALIEVPGSRAEVLFGYGTAINIDDWIAARES